MAKNKVVYGLKSVKLQTLTVEEDPFVPTSGDLAGFWDMVYIQVEHIHTLFAELAKIRENGWKRVEVRRIYDFTPKSFVLNPFISASF